jgi:hypothetical protein
MRNDGYSAVPKFDGYYAQYWTMNSQTFGVNIREEHGPFESETDAAAECKRMREANEWRMQA